MAHKTQSGSASPEQRNTGISNRESAADEAAERSELPPKLETPPPAEDAAGNRDEERFGPPGENQTSHKTGSHSIAVKESEARYTDRHMPPTSKVAGAFGKEPQD